MLASSRWTISPHGERESNSPPEFWRLRCALHFAVEGSFLGWFRPDVRASQRLVGESNSFRPGDNRPALQARHEALRGLPGESRTLADRLGNGRWDPPRQGGENSFPHTKACEKPVREKGFEPPITGTQSRRVTTSPLSVIERDRTRVVGRIGVEPIWSAFQTDAMTALALYPLRPHGASNPDFRIENPVSLPVRR